MKGKGPEMGYIHDIDRSNNLEEDSLGKLTEETVLQFYREYFPGKFIRYSTDQEDSGLYDESYHHKGIDLVFGDKENDREIPLLALQTTSNDQPWNVQKKMKEMAEKPFMRLQGMRNQDMAVPRAIVFLNPDQVKSFSRDKDIKKHPEIGLKIINDTVNSLTFDLTKTRNPKEQQHLKNMITELIRVQSEIQGSLKKAA